MNLLDSSPYSERGDNPDEERVEEAWVLIIRSFYVSEEASLSMMNKLKLTVYYTFEYAMPKGLPKKNEASLYPELLGLLPYFEL